MDLFTALEEWKRTDGIVQDCDALEGMVSKLERAEIIAVDTETTSLDYRTLELVGIGFATLDFGSWYVPLGHIISHPQLSVASVIGAVEHFFRRPDKMFVFHNAKFDIRVLNKFGVTVESPIMDTMIMSWLLDENSKHGLKFLAKYYLDIDMTNLEDIVSDKNPAHGSIYKVGEYCRADAENTLKLYEHFMPMLKEDKLDRANRLEMELLPVVIDMENRGAFVDINRLEALKEVVDSLVEEHKKEVIAEADIEFNVDSSQHIGEIIYNRMGYKPQKFTNKGQPSTDIEALRAVLRANPECSIIQKLLDYRHYNKIKNTYIDSMSGKVIDGKVYATFKQLGAETGRFSSENPNLQNIPRTGEEDELKIRNVFYAPEGYRLIVADYNQVELRVLAHFCGDANMLSAFKSGKDIHKSTASMMFDVPLSKVNKTQRYEAKALNFGLVYGMRVYGLANRIGKYDDIDYAQKLMDKYFEVYSSIRPWSAEQVALCRNNGFIRTLVGRKRRIVHIDSEDNTVRKSAERQAINSIVQGSAADIIKGAMIKLYRNAELKDLDVHIMMQVHDELVFICPEDNVDRAKEIIREVMEHPFKRELRLPITVEIADVKYWGDAK